MPESQIGERKWDSGTAEVVPTVNAGACDRLHRWGHDECWPVRDRARQVLNVARFGTDDSNELWVKKKGTVGFTRVWEQGDEQEVTALRTRSRRLLEEDDGAN